MANVEVNTDVNGHSEEVEDGQVAEDVDGTVVESTENATETKSKKKKNKKKKPAAKTESNDEVKNETTDKADEGDEAEAEGTVIQ